MILVRYDDARTAVATHMAASGSKKSALTDALADLQRKTQQQGITDYKKQNHKLCTDAIEGFQAAESGARTVRTGRAAALGEDSRADRARPGCQFLYHE